MPFPRPLSSANSPECRSVVGPPTPPLCVLLDASQQPLMPVFPEKYVAGPAILADDLALHDSKGRKICVVPAMPAIEIFCARYETDAHFGCYGILNGVSLSPECVRVTKSVSYTHLTLPTNREV